MKVLLLHLDGRLPNVALMRLAAHHRVLGDEVTLRHAPTMALGDRTGAQLELLAEGGAS